LLEKYAKRGKVNERSNTNNTCQFYSCPRIWSPGKRCEVDVVVRMPDRSWKKCTALIDTGKDINFKKSHFSGNSLPKTNIFQVAANGNALRIHQDTIVEFSYED
jgi:hypothetical protein